MSAPPADAGAALIRVPDSVGSSGWLLSGTDEVVLGPGAVLHVLVWSGVALFVGVFFGLLAQRAS